MRVRSLIGSCMLSLSPLRSLFFKSWGAVAKNIPGIRNTYSIQIRAYLTRHLGRYPSTYYKRWTVLQPGYHDGYSSVRLGILSFNTQKLSFSHCIDSGMKIYRNIILHSMSYAVEATTCNLMHHTYIAQNVLTTSIWPTQTVFSERFLSLLFLLSIAQMLFLGSWMT